MAPVNGLYEFAMEQTRMDKLTGVISDETITKDLRYRISSVKILDTSESSFTTSDGIGTYSLEYGQDAIVSIQIKGKDWYNSGSDNDTGNNTAGFYTSLDHYSWFVNWNEYRLPNPAQPTAAPYSIPSPAFVTGTWNDRGTFSTSATYVAGDVFYYTDNAGYTDPDINRTGSWYTINPMLTSVSTGSVTDIYGNTVIPSAAYSTPDNPLGITSIVLMGRY